MILISIFATLVLIFSGLQYFKYGLSHFPSGPANVIDQAISNMFGWLILASALLLLLLIILKIKKIEFHWPKTIGIVAYLLICISVGLVFTILNQQSALYSSAMSPSSLESNSGLVDPVTRFPEPPVSKITCLLTSNKSECYRYLAGRLDDINYCKKSDMLCYVNFAYRKNDTSLCNSTRCVEYAEGLKDSR